MDQYSFLNALNTTQDSWRIRVRLCRLWESTNPQKDNELISIDMILCDEKETLMHATIKKHLAPRFRHILHQGFMYSMKNLKVVTATGNYRPLTSEFKIVFLAITSVQRLEEEIIQIPKHSFQFVVPDDVESRLNDKTILSDVVGLLTGIGEVDMVGDNWKKRDLEIITNHSITATITLWGKFSEQFDPNLYKEDDGPHIIIVTSTTIKRFKGAICFSSTYNSKIYMNLDIPYVMSLRERFAQHSKKLKVIGISNSKKFSLEEKMFYHRMSIKELVNSNWSKDLKEYIATVRGNIFRIDDSFGWYYVSCKSCEKKIVAEDGVYKCDICQKIVDYPLVMFKVHVHVRDQTGNTTLTLFNNIVERLLDTSAKKLVNRLSPGDNELPRELNTLLGKNLIYKLRLNDYNFKQGYANYTVSEVYQPEESLEQKYESKKSLQIHDNLEDNLKSRILDDKEDTENDNDSYKLKDVESHDNSKAGDGDKKRKRKIIIDVVHNFSIQLCYY